ncbi:hypothetical protein [Pseudomonas guariconensis]|uniref:hypothetical protein n=1 Tax=Pseudomonas guariconensis TaxID=1288410 RepID=UPI003906652D
MSDNQITGELLACPFCNAAMRIESNRDWHRVMGEHDDNCVFNDSEALMGPATDDQRDLIVRDWNRRAQLQGEPVALPARMPTGNITEPHHPWAPGVREGWNKCLDEFAKLGTLRTRLVQGEPVVPGHRLDALDALVADGDPQSDANVSNANVAELIRAVRTLQARTITSSGEPGAVERLRTEIRSLRQHKTDYMDAAEETRKALLAQLATQDALLRQLAADPSGSIRHYINSIDAALSASAEATEGGAQ